ncbi:pyridoxamine 5'-phosphate oxidase family protein [Halomonas sp. SpR8]|uniref:2Fe-2S iron-sulfur cluster-binding protein n=1 Tax=Halomonas sp. SpR8 TaxID=3050463 RepID=UPI0027E4F22A|nr:pyridoxamine 5'-phosphate oxidase family protein [Halomonas sp. SpR8]MDQ7729594.1 pyridoxamine 5'-phosphate oxidase family protein [Halomonas sp. SpR8]
MENAVTISPWHAGELALQRVVGVEQQMAQIGSKVMRPFLTPQLQHFFPQLPFVAAAAEDSDGWPWITLLEGAPGFVQASDETRLDLAVTPPADDPLIPLLTSGASLGLLGIELPTRRRNRVNGVLRGSAGQWQLEVVHAFGNCPQYIHDWSAMRSVQPQPGPVLTLRDATLDQLPEPLLAHIDRALTAFVGSYARTDQGVQVDASHRGGQAGFIRRQGADLILPDFAGNQFFNTLGNVLASGRAALVIPDFVSGDVLHLSGEARLVDEESAGARYPGAERYWCLTPRHIVWRPGALRWRSHAGAVAVEAEPHGPWQALAPSALQRVQVTAVVEETPEIRSFYLQSCQQGIALAPFEAGQFITLRVPRLDGTSLVRSYTLSGSRREKSYRISIKADGEGSRYLHKALKVGSELAVSQPTGSFTAAASGGERAHWVLLGGGIGITPLVSLAHELTAAGRGPVTLVQSVRAMAEAPFGEELLDLERRGLRLRRHVTGAATARKEWMAGRVSLARVLSEQVFSEQALAEVQLYLCGPAAFVQRYHQEALELGLSAAQIHTEAFGPSALAQAFTVPAAEQAVEVSFANSNVATHWQPGESLLETAEKAGLQPAYGCRSGSCGECACTLAQGEVSYPDGISAPEGKILLCSARPAAHSGRIAITLPNG